jgi:ketosteroid isomerase-like protein
MSASSTSNDEMDIKAHIERWAKAVREQNRAGIRAAHDSEMLMFDVPPPLLSRGLDAYMATWKGSCRGQRSQSALTFAMSRSRLERTLHSLRR